MDNRKHQIQTAVPARQRGAIAPAQLAHVVLRTSQFRKMIDWYCALLNAQSNFENNRLAFLSYDEEHHRIAIANMPVLGKRNKSRAGVDHVAFTYASIADLLENHGRLRELGIRPAWAINHGPTTSMYYEDPDGNFVELQVDNFDSVEELSKWMTTGEFEENPIGVNFDPDQLLARLRVGEPEEELKRRPRAQEAEVPEAYLGGWISFLRKVVRAFGADV